MPVFRYVLFAAVAIAALAGAVYLGGAFLKRNRLSFAGQEGRAHSAVRLCLPFAQAVLLALFLFWAVQTGIERRIGLGLTGLFAFIEDGLPRPGRLAILCAALLVCLFLFLTPAGKSLRDKLNAAYKKDWARWAVSAVVTGLFVLWTARVTVFSFMTNDDTYIMRLIARIPENGLSAASNSFSSVLFSGLLSLFYRINPDGYWYAWYHIFAISASLVIIGRCILVKTARRGWPVLAGCLIHLILCAGVFVYPLAELSFTITPAVVGTAAIALVLCRSDTASAAGRVLSDVLSVVLMLLCVLQRWATGSCLLCFWGVAVVYQGLKIFLHREPKWKGQLLRFGLCVLAAAALVAGCRTIGKSETYIDTDYKMAEHYRSIVMDYLIEDLSNEQLEAAGLPPELSTLLRNWYFMDERINTETFKTIKEMYYTGDEDRSAEALPATILACIPVVFATIWSTPRMLIMSLCIVLLLLLAAAAFIHGGRRYWPEFLCALCAAGGAFFLCVYLVLYGRFPLRAFLVAAIPAIAVILLMALSVPEGAAPLPQKRHRAVTGGAGLISLLLCVCCGVSLFRIPYIRQYADRQTLFETQWALESYANDHGDIYFVTSFTAENLDPFHSGSYPSNMGLWGGTGVTASTSRLYAADFFRDDIQFMCERPSIVLSLLQYLSLDYGPVQALTVSQIVDLFTAYDISQVTPGEDYTGWYEQNGLTYYFEDGQAVTGTQVIDGVEYEFAPAGADTSIVAFASEDGIIYSTNAYSLISSGE